MPHSLGEMITARRAQLGVSDETAAHEVGVKTSTFGRWRRDLFKPERDKVPALAAWLGVEQGVVLAVISADRPPDDDVVSQVAELAREVAGLRSELAELRAEVRGPQPAGQR